MVRYCCFTLKRFLPFLQNCFYFGTQFDLLFVICYFRIYSLLSTAEVKNLSAPAGWKKHGSTQNISPATRDHSFCCCIPMVLVPRGKDLTVCQVAFPARNVRPHTSQPLQLPHCPMQTKLSRGKSCPNLSGL